MAEPLLDRKLPALVSDNNRANAGNMDQTAASGGVHDASSLEKELSRVEGNKWLRRGLVFLAVVAVGVAIFGYRAKVQPPPPPRYVTAEVTRGDIREVVQSTGQIKPLTEVQVGAQVSGRITKVFVDFNSVVKAGDVLAEIDPTLFGAQIDSTEAQLRAARANIKRAESTLAGAKQRLDRGQKLAQEGIGTQADLDAAQAAYDQAVAEVAAARAQSGQYEAMLRSSRTNLEYTRIYSPIDGIVISRAIDPGQTVAASFQAPTLFVIAQDLRRMRVLADIDEADVGKLKEGMSADVTVDAFPGEKFQGTVSQVRYSPVNVSGVVTYAAVIEVHNPETKLRPGMTATVNVTSSEVKNVMQLPNAALRFKPTPEKDGKELPPQALPPRKGRIYVVTDETKGAEKIEPRVVDVGITNGVSTELLTDIGPSKVVTDEADDTEKKKGRGPRMF